MSCVPVASLRNAKLPARIGATFLTLCLIAGPILAHAAEGGAAAPAPAATPQAPAPAPDAAATPAKVTLPIVYLGKQYEEPLPLSYAEEIITDKGIQGARVSIKEANQAGNFVGNAFELVEAIVPADGDVVAKAKEILKNGDALIVADLEAPDLLAVADLPEAKNSVIMNIRSNDVALRQEQCRQNVFHIIPDWAMRADAIAQYLIWKRWPRWAIIRGDLPGRQGFRRPDPALGETLRRQDRRRARLHLPARRPQSRLRPSAGAGADPDGDRRHAGKRRAVGRQ